MYQFLKTLRWGRAKSFAGAIRKAPMKSGVYAFGRVERVLELPVNLEWGYVGRSENIRRRLTEHQPRNEVNFRLRDWLKTHQRNLEIWFATTPGEVTSEIEKQLIQELRPAINEIHAKSGDRQ